ncbi:MAG: DUF1361 domain-containing protein [Saprospiraceae bacterium]
MNALLARYGHLAALALLVFWNTLLVWCRFQMTDKRVFIFFLWNLFLAIVPYLSSEAAGHFSKRKKRAAAIGLVLLAVLFLPNSPYIITDFFHLRQRAEMPLWFDTMLIFSLAISGLALFYVALFNIRDLLARWLGSVVAEIFVGLISFLSAFGIYLGRYLRFNSWDVISNPNILFEEIADRFINPSVHTRTVGMTLLYGAFLLVGYWVARLFRGQRNELVEVVAL